MKSLIVFSIAAFGLAFTLPSRAQDHATSLPGTYTEPKTGLGSNSQTATGATPTPAPEERNTDENDDTLYHGKTSDMETTLLRDDGALHFKTRPKEKSHEVNSLQSLQSAGTDPKFQGSFISSGVSSIEKVAEKGNQAKPAAEGDEAAAPPPSDSRFVRRHLTFAPAEEEKSKKAEADSSPSPTPSPSGSPTTTKKSSDSKP